jgi:hypothetical protein
MWIVKLALDRPYTFVVAALLVLILGVLAILHTPTDIFPNINIPVISVVWTYSGLPPEEIQHRIVTVFERAATTTVNNIEHMESQSYSGSYRSSNLPFFFSDHPQICQIQPLNLASGPGSLSQKGQAGFHARVALKAPDIDDAAHFLPAVVVYQIGQYLFQSNAVQRIVWLCFSHIGT